ncbi:MULTISPECIES: GntR family transcriptional regulator [Serratia]|uniref:GntR family transcriptional regulator n=1 Tax=Serratia TaxID=613 RepID=UPI0027F1754C|nr:GntR family transcriptional regulator [Serratia fonticola]MDQ7210325.1 GntR family transcriptional regulator [Serratia fonticola]
MMVNELEQAAPLYLHIAKNLRERIEAGEFPLDSLLPPEQALCQHYQCGRVTLRAAVEMLAQRGYLTKKRGFGTMITTPAWLSDNTLPVSFSEKMEQAGLAHHTQVLRLERCQPSLQQAQNLNLPPQQQVLLLERLRFVEGLPALYETTLLPAERFATLDRLRVEQYGLYYTLARDFNLLSMQAQDDYRALAASTLVAQRLDFSPGQSCIEITRLASSHGTPFELTVSYANTERYPLSFRYLRG